MTSGVVAIVLIALVSTCAAVIFFLKARNLDYEKERLLKAKADLNESLSANQEELRSLKKSIRIHEQELSMMKRFAVLTNIAESGACLCNVNGEIEWINNSWELTTGYSLEECKGKKPGHLLQGPDTDHQTIQRIRTALASRQPVTEELANYTKTGTRIWVRIQIAPIYNDSGVLIGFGGVQTDLTLKRLTQKRLERLHERAELALSAGQYGVWEWIPPKNQCEWDERTCRLYGSETGAGNYEEWISLIHRGDQQVVENHLRSVLIGKENLKTSFRTQPNEVGTIRTLEICGTVQRDDNGSPQRMTGIVRDITAELSIREQLVLAMERLRLSLKGARDGVWEWKVEDDKFILDDRWTAISSAQTSPNASRREFEACIHHEDVSLFRGALDSLISGDKGHIEVECRVQGANETWVWIGWRGGVLQNPHDPLKRTICGTYSDVSIQHHTAEALHRSTLLLRQMCQQMGIAAWEVEAGTYRLHWTEELDLLHSAPPDFIPSIENFLGLYPTDSRRELSSLLEIAFDAGECFDVEIRWNANGLAKNSWFRWIGQPVSQNGKIIAVCGLIQNVSSAHEAAAQRRELDAKIAELHQYETLSAITDDLAYDLNSMLNSVLGFQELAVDELPPGHKVREYLMESMRNTHRTHDIIRQVLLLNKVRPAARMELRLPLIVDEVCDRVSAIIGSPSRLDKNVDRRCPSIIGDAAQLQHAFTNIATHAAAAVSGKAQAISISLQSVSISSEEAIALDIGHQGPSISLEFRADGCQLPQEEWKAIFSYAEKDPGLHLTAARKILSEHGGSLCISYRGENTAVCQVILPSAEKTSPAPFAPAVATNRQVWIIDEERFISHLAKLSLERSGYRVRVLRSPAECLTQLQIDGVECAVLLLGNCLRDSTPSQLVQEARSLRPGLPAVAICTQANQSDVPGCVGLAEPFTAADLNRALVEALANHGIQSRNS